MIVHPRQALGREAVPLWVIDEAHPAPQTLVDAAASLPFAAEPGGFYPGVRSEAPGDYMAWLKSTITDMPDFGRVEVLRASFAVTTSDPATLAPIQRIPHFDGPEDDVFATVHYLCAPPHRGTAFFRHARTGFERITAARSPLWRQSLSEDRAQYGLPAGRYHEGDRQGFEQTGYADCAFNRLIVYPANCLHSGDISDSWRAGEFSAARLTVTSLFRARGSLSSA